MKTLIFTNNSDVRVEFVVDLIGSNSDNLTVMEVRNLDTIKEESLFQGFQKLPYSLEEFKNFAKNNELSLIEETQDQVVTIVETTTTTTEEPTTTTTTTEG